MLYLISFFKVFYKYFPKSYEINYQQNIIKNMDSLMFTFSADQMSMQMQPTSKYGTLEGRSIRKRPTSHNPSEKSRSRILSSNSNQLFENSNFGNIPFTESPQKAINTIKVKSTSIQMHQKKKLRSIIDNMLCKNFDTSNFNKIEYTGSSNRKNINKHRGFLLGTMKMQKNQKQIVGRESKQNQFNLQNIDVKSIKQINAQQNQIKKKPNIKIKKYEFANLKFNKMNQYSQRYNQTLKQQRVLKNDHNFANVSHQYIQKDSLNIQRNILHIQRDSLNIDRDSINKKMLRSKTPKIMYPQSDSKLPSIFRTKYGRSSCKNSLGKRKTRILSAQFISHEGNNHQQTNSVKNKNTLQEEKIMDPLIRTRTRPLSMMLESRKNHILIHKKQEANQFLNPRKLIFQNQNVDQAINKKLMRNSEIENKKLVLSTVQNKNLSVRVGSRAKSTHVNHPHRKLRQLNSYLNQPICKDYDLSNVVIKNQSQNSKQTFQSSTLHSSTDRTLVNLSNKCQKASEQIQCSITFHISKKE